MRKTMKFVLGAIAGGILGCIIILLYTPGSGEETRISVNEKINLFKSQIQSAIRKKREELERELESYIQA